MAGIKQAKAYKWNREKGSAATTLIVLAFFLAVIGLVALFRFMVYLGGSQEVNNSVDAGALNMASNAVLVKLQPAQVSGTYQDVADTHGEVGLQNINRVWGKAYLIGANGEEIVNSQFCPQNISDVNDPVTATWTAANVMNSSLWKFLLNEAAPDPTQPGQLFPWHEVFFNNLARDKPAKLLGAQGNVSGISQDYRMACLYRGDESNLAVGDMDAIPKGAHCFTTQYQAQNFMQGYKPVQANSHYYYFVTFHCNETPHLLSAQVFNKNLDPIANVQSPIPNAFRKTGQLTGQTTLSYTACAVANPMRTYELAIPHSYVQITIENMALWNVQGQQASRTFYNFNTGKVWGVKEWKLKQPAQGVLDGYAKLGQEYWPNLNPYAPQDGPNSSPNLLVAIEALPGDHAIAYAKILQRIKEFAPGYTTAQLRTLLQDTPLVPTASTQTGIQTYYIYPTYKTKDNTDPKVCAGATNLPGWMQPGTPEGMAKPILTETPSTNKPNTCWSTIIGPYPTDLHSTQETGTFYWAPGIGNQNLGNLQIVRQTTINFTGMPPV